MNTRSAARLALKLLLVAVVTVGSATAQEGATVRGTVGTADGPLAGATMRVRNTDNETTSGADGSFVLDGLTAGESVEITAWADGYYIAYLQVTPPATDIALLLRPYHTSDNPAYEWPSPLPNASDGACGNCHPMIINQWAGNAHGSAINNARFYSLYNGTDLSGSAKVGRGYVDDFPGTAGNCAQCHAPGAGLDAYLNVNMNDIRGEITAGIHCDYCHKIGGVYLNPATGSVYANAPGAQSTLMLRPPEGDNIFFGPYDDIHDPDTRLPLISESAFCAPCHQFSMWGTHIYESYSEWLASPYANEGVTCQQCHMPPTGDTLFALPEAGGLEHAAETIPSHLQLGAASETLLQDTAALDLNVQQRGNQLEVTVAVTNTGAGHHMPTDYPGRQMILTIEAVAQEGSTLPLIEGATIPDWGGPQAGLPGTVFAKLLKDAITLEMPVVTYWRQTLLAEDTRLPARETHLSRYTFAAREDGNPVRVTARLIFRRQFMAEAEARMWDTPDIIMEEAAVILE